MRNRLLGVTEEARAAEMAVAARRVVATVDADAAGATPRQAVHFRIEATSLRMQIAVAG